MTTTADFSSFSEPQQTDYRKQVVTADLPSYAQKEEAAVFALTKQEYERIEKKYGTIKSTAIRGAEDMTVNTGSSVSLPEQVTVEYSDGSTADMGVDWDTSHLDFDLSHMKEGT